MKILNWQLFLEELVGDIEISNVDNYVEGMQKSLDDKLFFVDKLDLENVGKAFNVKIKHSTHVKMIIKNNSL